MGKCYNCREESDDFLCPLCREAVSSGAIHLTFPGVTGVESGPGSGENELTFMRDDTYNEVRITLRKMEENGKLNTPEKVNQAKTVLAHAERYKGQRIDKQKTGELF